MAPFGTPILGTYVNWVVPKHGSLRQNYFVIKSGLQRQGLCGQERGGFRARFTKSGRFSGNW